MPAAPATITCPSCGMQYDGTGMKSGVQFQCTQCQGMVVVGAPAKPGLPGKKGNTRMGKGPTRGPARGGQPAPYGAQGQAQQQPYGAPIPKKDNTMVIGGIIAGVILVALIGTIVVLSTNKDSQQRASKEAEEKAAADDKRKQEQRNEQTLNESEARTKTIDAGTAAGDKIASLLASGDMNGLGGMFDWEVVQADFSNQLEKQSKDPPMKDGQPEVDKNGKPKLANYQKFLNDPIYCVGDWEKNADGRYTGLYIGKQVRGPDQLRERVMWYIGECYKGVPASVDGAAMEKDKNKAKFSITLNNKTYVGRVCMVKSSSAAKFLSFFVGGLQGELNVKILRFDDPQRGEKVKQLEAKFQRKDNPQDEQAFDNPDRDPGRDPSKDPEKEPEGPDTSLAEAKKTGAQCPADLVNIFRDLRDGKEITNAQKMTLQDQSRPRADRKAFIGALLDVLIDNFTAKKRIECANISKALFAVWGQACGYPEKDATFEPTADFDSNADFPLRVWYDYYNRYPVK